MFQLRRKKFDGGFFPCLFLKTWRRLDFHSNGKVEEDKMIGAQKGGHEGKLL